MQGRGREVLRFQIIVYNGGSDNRYFTHYSFNGFTRTTAAREFLAHNGAERRGSGRCQTCPHPNRPFREMPTIKLWIIYYQTRKRKLNLIILPLFNAQPYIYSDWFYTETSVFADFFLVQWHIKTTFKSWKYSYRSSPCNHENSGALFQFLRFGCFYLMAFHFQSLNIFTRLFSPLELVV